MSGRPNLPLDAKIELRRAYREVLDRQKRSFFREQAKRLGYSWRTIQRAVLG